VSVKVTDHDRGFRRILKLLQKQAKRADVRVGWFQTAKHPSGISTAAIATVHEYGSEKAHVPKRAMLAPTVDTHRAEYARLYREAWASAIDGKEPIERSLLRYGNRVRNDVVRLIVAGDFVPLAQSTIDRKGSSKPLQDTGTMRDQVEVRVA